MRRWIRKWGREIDVDRSIRASQAQERVSEQLRNAGIRLLHPPAQQKKIVEVDQSGEEAGSGAMPRLGPVFFAQKTRGSGQPTRFCV